MPSSLPRYHNEIVGILSGHVAHKFTALRLIELYPPPFFRYVHCNSDGVIGRGDHSRWFCCWRDWIANSAIIVAEFFSFANINQLLIGRQLRCPYLAKRHRSLVGQRL